MILKKIICDECKQLLETGRHIVITTEGSESMLIDDWSVKGEHSKQLITNFPKHFCNEECLVTHVKNILLNLQKERR